MRQNIAKRISTGIEGLDEMIYGGVPSGHIIILKAPTGGGKTTAGLQFAYSSVQKGLSCTFISSSVDESYLIQMGRLYGWEFGEFVEEGLLNFKFLPPVITELEPLQKIMEHEKSTPQDFKIEVITERVEELAKFLTTVDSEVIIIDSISEYLFLVEDEIKRRGYILHIYNIIKSKEVTALINMEEEFSFYEAEIFADGIIRFYRNQSLNRGEVDYLIEIMKMRLTNHSKEIREYKITSEGIKIFSKYGVI